MLDYLVKETQNEIAAFNESRGRRKILNPIFTKLNHPVNKFGRIVEGDSDKILQAMARATVRTLLERKPRPTEADLVLYQKNDYGKTKYLVSLRVPKRLIN